jgi:hypothetical protein
MAMFKGQAKRGSSNSDEINVNDESACIRWSHELGVTAGELKAAVHYAGRKIEDVRRYIKERTRHQEKAPFEQ